MNEELINEVVKTLEQRYHLIPRRSHYDSKHLEPYMILDVVAGEVSKFYAVDVNKLRSKDRSGGLPQCRQIYFYIARLVSNRVISLNYMATYINRDHATAIHGVKRVKDLMQFEEGFKKEVETILSNVQGVLSDKKEQILGSLKDN